MRGIVVILILTLLVFVGCREELNDDNFPGIYLGFYAEFGDDDTDDADQLVEMGYEVEEVKAYLLELFEDEARFEQVYERIIEEDFGVGWIFTFLVLEIGLGDSADWEGFGEGLEGLDEALLWLEEALDDFGLEEEPGEEFEEALLELEEALSELEGVE